MKRKQVNSDSFPMHWTLAISESEQVIWRNPRFYSHWRSPFFIRVIREIRGSNCCF